MLRGKIWLYLAREILVNLFGYKLKLRSVLKGRENLNLIGKIERDVTDKGKKHFTLIHSLLKRFEIEVERDCFLELGPGGSLLHGCMLLSAGWKSYIGVDKFVSDVWGRYPTQVLEGWASGSTAEESRLVKSALATKGDAVNLKYFAGIGVLDPRISEFLDGGDISLSYSWGVMEHIIEVDLVFEKLFELTCPGGYAIHVIDTHPHTWLRFDDPLVIYTISDSFWQFAYSGRGFITRRMPSDYCGAAMKAGFEVICSEREIAKNSANLKSIEKLWGRFKGEPLEELLTHRLLLILKK